MLFITPPTIETPLSAEAELQTQVLRKCNSSGQYAQIGSSLLSQEVKAFSLEGRGDQNSDNLSVHESEDQATLDDSMNWEGKMNSLLQSPKEKKEKPQIPNIDFQLCSTLTTQQFHQQNSILSTASSTKTSSFLAIPSPNLSCNASFPMLQRGGSTSNLWQRSNSHDLSGNPSLQSPASNLFSPTSAAKKSKQHFTFPDGGWVCSACQNYNFYGKSQNNRVGRTKCNRCQKQKTKQDTNGKPRHLLKKEQQSQIPPQAQNVQRVYKKPLTQRVGDWVCLNCRNLNFSFRDICNRCNVSREMYGQYAHRESGVSAHGFNNAYPSMQNGGPSYGQTQQQNGGMNSGKGKAQEAPQ